MPSSCRGLHAQGCGLHANKTQQPRHAFWVFINLGMLFADVNGPICMWPDAAAESGHFPATMMLWYDLGALLLLMARCGLTVEHVASRHMQVARRHTQHLC